LISSVTLSSGQLQVPFVTQPRVVARFGLFEVDLRSGELRKQGVKVKLQEQPFQILVTLVQHAGELVTREELRRQLWPSDTFVDFEHGLNVAVKRLRDALGDSAENPVFIETLARRGYRFIAPVEGMPNATAIETVSAPVRSKTSARRVGIAVALVSLIFILVAEWRIVHHPQSRTSELTEVKLTTNSSENSVSSAAISPDGKLLAYSDSTGVYLKQIRTGETHQLRLSADLSTHLHIDDWYPDGSHLLITREPPGENPSLWAISVFGGSPRQLTGNGEAGSVSPDGAHIAFHRLDSAQQEWVMRSDGTDAVKVADDKSSALLQPKWSPDGNRIVYIKFTFVYNGSLGTGSIEINEWRKARVESLLSDSQLGPALNWLSDGRLIFSRWSSDHRQDAGLWAVSPTQAGKAASAPKQIVGGHGWISQISRSRDSKIVTYLRGNLVPNAYIATLDPAGERVVSKRRLTLDENENDAFAWTADGKSVLISSGRNGTMEIFKQGVDQSIPENLVTSHEQLLQPKLAPGGSEILYVSAPKMAPSDIQSSLFAIPIIGGAPRLILKDVNIWNVQCAHLPSTFCMYSNGKRETFRFDPSNGKSSEPAQIDPLCNWALSPDGSLRALVLPGPKGTIRFRSTTTGESRDVQVKGGHELGSVDWAPNGKSLYIAGRSSNGESVLLHITLDGRVTVLLRSNNSEMLAGIPSPDRRYLALEEARGSNNVWMIENY
jgi:DNA-binding winged helix-turn-helix (wHTH) protein/Tol biopolymer transport system component